MLHCPLSPLMLILISGTLAAVPSQPATPTYTQNSNLNLFTKAPLLVRNDIAPCQERALQIRSMLWTGRLKTISTSRIQLTPSQSWLATESALWRYACCKWVMHQVQAAQAKAQSAPCNISQRQLHQALQVRIECWLHLRMHISTICQTLAHSIVDSIRYWLGPDVP